MDKIKSFIPNLLTLGNLLCGCLAIYVLLATEPIINNPYPGAESGPYWPIYHPLFISTVLIFLALFLDFFDGFVARILGVDSEIGKQLDSLADMISFGVFPGVLLATATASNYYVTDISETMYWSGSKIFPFAFIIPLFAAYRLAKFNIDSEQSTYFKGIATPAYSLFTIGVVWFYFNNKSVVESFNQTSLSEDISTFKEFIPIPILLISTLLAFLMVSNIPMFSFKMNNFGWKENWFRYLLILVSIPLLIWLKIGAFALIIPIYILLSLIARKSFVTN